MPIIIDEKIPDFSFSCTDSSITSFKDCEGKWLVLYFYPKDNTPGCTREANDFNEHLDSFTALNARIIGVSRDGLKVHERFIQKHELNFPLISDGNSILCDDFDIIRSKSMYGKTFLGIERSTFLIDPNGIITEAWRKISVKGHVEKVLETLKQSVACD